MALITCPECGKKISDKATSCPNCGCPIASVKNLQELSKQEEVRQHETNKTKQTNMIVGLVVATFLIVTLGISYWNSTSAERAHKALKKSMSEYDKTSKELESLENELDYNQALIDEYEKNHK